MLTILSFALIILAVHLPSAQSGVPQYWFATKSKISQEQTLTLDFRGCYGPDCVYVASSVSVDSSTMIGRVQPPQRLWIMGFPDKTVEYVFSVERPKDLPSALWIAPVADHRVIPAVFNASKYLSKVAAPDPSVARFVNHLKSHRIQETVEHLASYNSRNSYSADAPVAAAWIKDFMESKGCQKAQLITFRSGFSPNVVCEFPGTDSNADPVVVGAHYDSRAASVSSPTQRAPGADDNGSGSAAALEILTTAYELVNEGFSIEKPIIFALFAGEEQGLLGSAALARSYANSGVELTAMMNLDMIGYPDRSYPNTLYWDADATTASLTELGVQLTKTYLGESTQVSYSYGCCSDQESFYNNGFPAVSVFESRSATNNPNYHKATDLPNTVNYQHVHRNAQSASALIATLAGITSRK